MASFAVSVRFLHQRPNASMPFKPGYEEDGFLKSLSPFKLTEIELLASNCTEVCIYIQPYCTHLSNAYECQWTWKMTVLNCILTWRSVMQTYEEKEMMKINYNLISFRKRFLTFEYLKET